MKVALIVDDNYIDELIFTIQLANLRSSSEHDYWVFFEELSDLSLKRIAMLGERSNLKIKTVKVNPNSDYMDNGHISKASFLRLDIPKTLSGHVIYLDLDLLLRKGWDLLSRFDSEEFAISAREHWYPSADEFNEDGRRNQAVALTGSRYFNAGVLVINSEPWNSSTWKARLQDGLTNYQHYGFRFSDQCVLNFAAAGSYLSIPPTFNAAFWEKDSRSAYIVHFAGSQKPWHSRGWFLWFRDRVMVNLAIRLKSNPLAPKKWRGPEARIEYHLWSALFNLIEYRITRSLMRIRFTL